MKNLIIGILTIMIIIVGGILIYQYKFEDKLDDNNSINVNDDKDIIDIDGDMIVQFNKEFFDLKDIAKEYVSSRDFDGVSKFSYDLDDDGVVDKISFYKKDESDAYSIELNGKVVVEGYGFNPGFYVVDLNEDDNLLEIVSYDEGSSWDPKYTIYSKKGDSLEKVYSKKGELFKCDKEGTVLIDDSLSGMYSPEVYFDYMYINNGIATDKNIDLQTIANIHFKNSKLFFSSDYANKDEVFNVGLDSSKLAEINVEQLNDDISFKILDVENITNNGIIEKKIKVELSDGRVGYIFYVAFSG